MATFKHKPASIPRFDRVAARLSSAARKLRYAAVRTFALEEKERFVARVRDQDFAAFDARPLSPAYLARKKALNLDLRTMIATGRYLKEIKVLEVDYGRGRHTFLVGFDEADRVLGVDGEETDLPLDLLAKVHEFGSAAAGVAPRPHWRPHLEDMRKRAGAVRPDVAKQAVAAARRAL